MQPSIYLQENSKNVNLEDSNIDMDCDKVGYSVVNSGASFTKCNIMKNKVILELAVLLLSVKNTYVV